MLLFHKLVSLISASAGCCILVSLIDVPATIKTITSNKTLFTASENSHAFSKIKKQLTSTEIKAKSTKIEIKNQKKLKETTTQEIVVYETSINDQIQQNQNLTSIVLNAKLELTNLSNNLNSVQEEEKKLDTKIKNIKNKLVIEKQEEQKLQAKVDESQLVFDDWDYITTIDLNTTDTNVQQENVKKVEKMIAVIDQKQSKCKLDIMRPLPKKLTINFRKNFVVYSAEEKNLLFEKLKKDMDLLQKAKSNFSNQQSLTESEKTEFNEQMKYINQKKSEAFNALSTKQIQLVSKQQKIQESTNLQKDTEKKIKEAKDKEQEINTKITVKTDEKTKSETMIKKNEESISNNQQNLTEKQKSLNETEKKLKEKVEQQTQQITTLIELQSQFD